MRYKGLIRRARRCFKHHVDILPDDTVTIGTRTIYAYECLPHVKIDKRWFQYFAATPEYGEMFDIDCKLQKSVLLYVKHHWVFSELESPTDSGSHFLDNPENYEFFLKYQKREGTYLSSCIELRFLLN